MTEPFPDISLGRHTSERPDLIVFRSKALSESVPDHRLYFYFGGVFEFESFGEGVSGRPIAIFTEPSAAS